MSEGTQRGALLGALTMVAITVMWTFLSGGVHEGTCPGDTGCWCRPLPPSAFLIGGFAVGLPWGALFGAAVGWLASRAGRQRRLLLGVVVFATASGLEAAAHHFMHCSTDPSAFALWSSAVVALGLAAVTLDRACR